MKKFFVMALVAIIGLSASAQSTQKKAVTTTATTISKVIIQTNGVCQQCADCFKKNVPTFKGVKSCTYDMKTSKLTVNYDPKATNPAEIRTQISKLGYNADNVKADPAARAKLPACCKTAKSTSSTCNKSCSGKTASSCQKSTNSKANGNSAAPAKSTAAPAKTTTAPAKTTTKK